MSLYSLASFDGTSPVMWIGLPDWRDDAHLIHDQPFAFTGSFETPRGVAHVRLRIACPTKYALYLDGVLVHEGPARSLSNEVFVDELRVACDGRLERHAIAVLLLPPLPVPASQVQDRIGLLAEIRSEEGKLVITTDEAWEVTPLSGIKFHGRSHSLHTSQQEHWTYDAIKTLFGLHASEHNGTSARVLGPPGTPPWRLAMRRDCALLVRNCIEGPPVICGRDGSEKLPATADLARAMNGRTIEPVDATSINDRLELNDDCNVITLDAARTRMVRPVLNVLAADADVRLEVFYDIGLVGRPTASIGFESASEGFVDSIETAGQPFEWRPIAAKGARYVTIRKAGTGVCRIRIQLESVDYPYREPTLPSGMDAELKEIWTRSIQTIRSSTTDVLVDTCWRENMLWTFDAAVTGHASYLAFGDATMWRRALGLVARWTEKCGAWPSSVAPAGSSAVILVDQSFWAMISLATYSSLTGETDFAQSAIECFAEFLDGCEQHLTSEDLFVPPGWCWHWIDWAPIDRRPYSLPVNLLLLLACESAVKIGKQTGRRKVREIAANIAARVRPALHRFWDESVGCFRDHLEPQNELPPPNQVVPMPRADYSAHANALALRANLGTPAQQQSTARYLALNLDALPFSPGYTGPVLEQLVEHGFGDIAMGQLRKLYRPWLLHQQPTWSEGFGQVERNTAHGWGASALIAIVAWLNQRAKAGLSPALAGQVV